MEENLIVLNLENLNKNSLNLNNIYSAVFASAVCNSENLNNCKSKILVKCKKENFEDCKTCLNNFNVENYKLVCDNLEFENEVKLYSCVKNISGNANFVNDKLEEITKSNAECCINCNTLLKYGADFLRFYVLKNGDFKNKFKFSTKDFLNCYKEDFALQIGNLTTRVCKMINQYFGGVVPKCSNDNNDMLLIKDAEKFAKNIVTYSKECNFNKYILEIINLTKRAIEYMSDSEPWILYKNKETDKLKNVVYVLYETLRFVACSLLAIMPKTAETIFECLGIKCVCLKTYSTISEFNFNLEGHKVVLPKQLFLNFSVDDEIKRFEAIFEPVLDSAKTKQLITIDDFDKLELKVGTIVDSCVVEGSTKLLKNTVKIGEEVRTIVSGIQKFYNPKDIIGKNVIVVANLQPIKLKGILSQGMILCAASDDDSDLSLLTTLKDMPSGTEVL